MPRNPQGLYTLPLPPVVPGELIEANWANPTLDDIASALTGSLPRNGTAPMLAPLTLSNIPPSQPRHAVDVGYVQQFLSYATGMPVGAVIPIAGSTIPGGFLLCDGRAVSRTVYADLFATIGTIYGSGDGATTFNVPDMRDWFIRGKSDVRQVGSTQAAAFAAHVHGVSDPGHSHTQTAHDHTITTGSHSHGVNDPGHSHTYGTIGGTGVIGFGAGGGYTSPANTSNNGTGISIQSAGNLGGATDSKQPGISSSQTGVSVGAAGGDETRPQNVAMNYVIKAANDSVSSAAIIGLTSSDDNCIGINNTNPVVPELDIHTNVAFGLVKLDGSATIPLNLLPSGSQQLLGYWDASSGTLPTGVFSSGDTYIISVPGTLVVYSPVTLTAAPTLVSAGALLQYITGSPTNPTGWYYVIQTVSGSANNVSFVQNGSGAITRSSAAKMQERVSINDFGAVGDGTTDDTTSVQNALNYAGSVGGGTVVVSNGMSVLIDSANLLIPANVTLSGESFAQTFVSNPTVDTACAIILNPLRTIQLGGSGGGLRNLYVLRKGLAKPTTIPEAVAEVASFTGTAVTIANAAGGTAVADDCTLENLFIAGFNQAIYGTYCGRYYISKVAGDNINGILTENVYDVGRILSCHFWPWITSGLGGTGSQNWRTGIGYDIESANDWTTLDDCFCFGYTTGFKINADSVIATACGADGNPSSKPAGTKGFHVTGASLDCKLIGCNSAAHETAYYFDSTGSASLNNCSGWGSPINHVYQSAGTLIASGCLFYDVASGGSIRVTAGVLRTAINNTRFDSVGAAYNIDLSAALKVDIDPKNIYNGTVSGLTSDTHRRIESTPALGTSWVAVGSGGGYQQKSALALGTPAAPLAVGNSTTLGSYRFLGYDGSAFVQSAIVRAGTAAVAAAGIVPSNIIFSTQNAAGSFADRVRVGSAGDLSPASDNAASCGIASLRWSSVWAANGTIQTSDMRDKVDVCDSILGLDFVRALRPVSYKWIVGGNEVVHQVFRNPDGIECGPSDDGAEPCEIITRAVPGVRTHWGFVAQEVKTVVDGYKVDFAGWVLSDMNDPDSRQAVRPDQFIAPLVKAVQELAAKLDAAMNEIMILKEKI